MQKQVFFGGVVVIIVFRSGGCLGDVPLCSHVPSASDSRRLPACARADDLGCGLARETAGELARTRRP